METSTAVLLGIGVTAVVGGAVAGTVLLMSRGGDGAVMGSTSAATNEPQKQQPPQGSGTATAADAAAAQVRAVIPPWLVPSGKGKPRSRSGGGLDLDKVVTGAKVVGNTVNTIAGFFS